MDELCERMLKEWDFGEVFKFYTTQGLLLTVKPPRMSIKRTTPLLKLGILFYDLNASRVVKGGKWLRSYKGVRVMASAAPKTHLLLIQKSLFIHPMFWAVDYANSFSLPVFTHEDDYRLWTALLASSSEYHEPNTQRLRRVDLIFNLIKFANSLLPPSSLDWPRLCIGV